MNETMCDIMIYGGITLAVILAIVAVILFIRLNIPKVIGDLTGRTAKKQIKEIREKGYESVQGSGASKKEAIKAKGGSGKITVRDIKSEPGKESEISKKGNERYKKAISELTETTKNEAADEYEKETDVLRPEDDYEAETNVLNAEEDYEAETNVLSAEEDYEAETNVLSAGEDYEAETNVLSAEEDYEAETNILSTEEYETETDILSSEGYEAETNVLVSDEEDATDVLRGYDEDGTDILSGYDDDATDVLNSKKVESPFETLVDIVVVHTDETI